MLLGAHVSSAGGLYKALERGDVIEAEIVQTFAGNPRSVRTTEFDEKALKQYQDAKQASQVKAHVFHGVYLINLAHESPSYVQACVDNLLYYQTVANTIDGIGTVFHVGSHKGKGFEHVLPQVANAIGNVLVNMPERVVLMLENAAGHKGTIGQTLEELASLHRAVEKLGITTDRLKLCIDSQHAFASGYAIHTPAGMAEFSSQLAEMFPPHIVAMLHFNDSLTAYNSHKDRHANLGEGEIGDEGLRVILKQAKLWQVPVVLEVPGQNKQGPGLMDVKHLRHLAHD